MPEHQEHGPTQHHQPEKSGNPKADGLLSGNKKWYLIGGLAVVGILVFFFVRQSNANSSTNGSTTGTAATTSSLDATTESELQSALQAINSGAYGSGSGGGGTTNNYYGSGTSSDTGSGVTSTTGGSGTGSTTSSGNGILPMDNPPGGDVWVIAVPNGTGGWMNAVFPTGQSVTQFYQNVGYNNGYPGGLSSNDITSALSQAGASVQSSLTNTKMAMSKAGSTSVPHTSK